MAVLVTGGAGYIGSAFVELLRAVGEPLVVLDDLSAGHRDAVPTDVPLYEGRVGDRRLVAELVGRHGVDVCVHFAGRIDVAESVAQPLRYYESNFVEGIALIDALTQAGVRRTVFSSTAAVYGSPRRIPICETDPCAPENPYGRSKLAFERCLADLDAATGSASVIFRYFNAAGATDDWYAMSDPHGCRRLVRS
jgi:UDP-glucose 4-epimerase